MLQDEYRKSLRISKITSLKISVAEKQSMIEESFIEEQQTKKNSSLKTIFMISNAMVGSGIVVVPIVFKESGIFTCLITIFIIGAVCFKTCSIQLVHFRPNESDFESSVKRILGKGGFYSYQISSIALLYLVGVIYFLLAANMLYPFLEYIGAVGASRAIKFDCFSFQYIGIILIGLNYFLFSLKDLTFIVKVGSLGIVSILFFIGYEIVMGIIGMIDLRTHPSHLKLVTADFSSILGVFGLAFVAHSLVTTILKSNQHQENNKRDTMIAYIFTGIIYASLGIFGGFSIAKYESISSAKTVLAYYEANVFTSICEILLFLQLISVIPIVWFVTRQQLLTLIYSEREPPIWVFHMLNIIFAACCLAIQIINFSPTMLIALDGAVCGFMLGYGIPISMHLFCLYKHKSSLKQSLIEKNEKAEEEQSHLNNNINHNNINSSNNNKNGYSYNQKIKEYSNNDISNNSEIIEKQRTESCISTHEKARKSYSKPFRYTGYGIIMLIGLAIAISTIVFQIQDAVS